MQLNPATQVEHWIVREPKGWEHVPQGPTLWQRWNPATKPKHIAAVIRSDGRVFIGQSRLHPLDYNKYSRKLGYRRSVAQALGRAAVEAQPFIRLTSGHLALGPKFVASEVFKCLRQGLLAVRSPRS